MDTITNYILEQVSSNNLSNEKAKMFIRELQSMKKTVKEDIAIIGMACKFPKADTIDEYWHLLINEINCIRDIPGHRIVLPKEYNLKYQPKGYLENISEFDTSFFNISPSEAKLMAPDQRLMLEIVTSAIEDSGYGADKLYYTKTGVYVGHDHCMGKDYRQYCIDIRSSDSLVTTGSYPALISGRISHMYKLNGPSLVIDTACSSGAVAIHLACNAIQENQCDMAIAGSVFVSAIGINDDGMSMILGENRLLRCFDNRSNGTIWGEGVATVILKPLKKAIADRDNIYAVIKGTAVNNDGGSSSGLLAPNAESQEKVILDIWKDLGINPEEIDYIEGHFTGTRIGDPIEMMALTNAFRKFTKKNQFCGIGSVKTNVGHLISSSGMASLIKVVLSLKKEKIPATINFGIPNYFINFCDSPVYINDKLTEWKRGKKIRLAGINSFGFSGTNCHIVLEEAPEIEPGIEIRHPKSCIFTLTAKDKDVLKNLVHKYIKFFDSDNELQFNDICYTAATARGHYNFRLAIIADNNKDLKAKLSIAYDSDLQNQPEKNIYYGRFKIVSKIERVIEEGDITEEKKRQLSKDAQDKAEKLQKSSGKNKQVLILLSEYYIRGAEIKWEELIFTKQTNRKVSLPLYPFKRIRYWSENLLLEHDDTGSTDSFLGRIKVDTIVNRIYQSKLSPENFRDVKDKAIPEKSVFPCTTYISIISEACMEYYDSLHFYFQDIRFYNPLIMEREENIELQTIINKKENEFIEILIFSKKDDNWIKHVSAKAGEIYFNVPEKVSINNIKNKCDKKIDTKENSITFEDNKLGAGKDLITEIYMGEKELFLTHELSDNLKVNPDEYTLPPALVDNIINLMIGLKGNTKSYLPVSCGSLEIFYPIPGKFHSHIYEKKNNSLNNEILIFDIVLLNPNGEIFAHISDYIVKIMNKNIFQYNQANTFLTLDWVSKKIIKTEIESDGENVLLFKAEGSWTSEIKSMLCAANYHVIEVSYGSKFKKIGDDIYCIGDSENDYKELIGLIKDKRITRIIHLFTLINNTNIKNFPELHASLHRGFFSVLYLFKALKANHLDQLVDIVLVSANAFEVTPDDMINYPHNALLFDLVEKNLIEYPHLRCRCIDIDTSVTPKMIYHELAACENESIAAYRNGERYVMLLNKLNMETVSERIFEIRDRGTYIFIGGMGAIGNEISKYLASDNRVNICFIDHKCIPEKQKWDIILKENTDEILCDAIKSIREVEKTVSTVTCFCADVSNKKEILAVLAAIRKKIGKINGIFYCSDIDSGNSITGQTEGEFVASLLFKVQSIWLLDKLTEKDDLDIFLLFSSRFSLPGISGQGIHNIGNLCLDSFASYRNKKGKRTVVVNWPVLREGDGMDKDNTNRYMFNPMPIPEAVAALNEIINKNISSVYLGDINFDLISGFWDDLRINISSNVKRFIDNGIKRITEKQNNSSKKLDHSIIIEGKDPNELSELEIEMGQIWASVLGLEKINIYHLFPDMGGDSVLAMNLLQELEKHFPGEEITAADIFTYSNVYEMAQYLENKQNPDIEVVPEKRQIPTKQDLENDAFLNKSFLPLKKSTNDFSYNNVFFTGSTGFLGAFLLRNLLEQTSATIHCLVRSKDEKSGLDRIEQNAHKYHLWNEKYRNRINPVIGDLSKKNFGLVDSEFNYYAGKIDNILHNGALLNFIYTYDGLKPVNILATKDILKLSITKKQKMVHYISSIYVFYKNSLDKFPPISEDASVSEYDVPPIGYTQTKLVSEFILKEASNRKMPVAVYRPVTISGDSKTGACTTDDFVWRLIKGCIQLRMYPNLDFPINIYPVDLLSKAIIYLSMQNKSVGRAFHFINLHSISFISLMRMVVDFGYPMREIEHTVWLPELINSANQSNNNALYALVPLFSDQRQLNKVYHNSFDNAKTLEALKNTGIKCPPVKKELVELYLRYFGKIGFFPSV